MKPKTATPQGRAATVRRDIVAAFFLASFSAYRLTWMQALSCKTCILDSVAIPVEVRFDSDLQNRLDKFARQSGRPAGELVQDAVAGYLDELAGTNAMLDSRYDDIKSGKVKLIPGDEVFAQLHARIEARRRREE